MEIKVLHRRGIGVRAIARELGVSRNTVRRYLRCPEVEPVYAARAPRPSKLDPFKKRLKARIAEASPRRLPATVHLRELQELGYDGGITILKEWLAEQHPALPEPDPVRFETPPGRQAQVDWTSIRRGKDRLSAFVGTLGFSRYSFVRFAEDGKFETPAGCHERFFDAIAGVPQTILFDNMKTVLIERNAYGPGAHRFNAGFREFAKHHGFSPRVCAPYRAQTKGKVERFIRYLKASFVWPLETRLNGGGIVLDAATANAHASFWLREVANPRVHAETKARPVDLLAEEAAHLLPRGRAWSGLAPSDPSDPRGIEVPQHDLSVYDAFCGAVGGAS